jgi:hypothetical protein
LAARGAAKAPPSGISAPFCGGDRRCGMQHFDYANRPTRGGVHRCKPKIRMALDRAILAGVSVLAPFVLLIVLIFITLLLEEVGVSV